MSNKEQSLLKCEVKHPQHEFPLNKTSVCHIFIGHHILPQGIQKDPAKIKVIIELPFPKNLRPPDL